MDISNAQKKQIIEQNMKSLKGEEFDLQIRKDVFKETGMDDRLEQVAEQLVQNRKLQKAYQDKLDEIEEE